MLIADIMEIPLTHTQFTHTTVFVSMLQVIELPMMHSCQVAVIMYSDEWSAR